MKEIHEELTYAHPPTEVFDLISTGAFQVGLLAHLGGRDPEVVEELRGDDGSVRIVTRQHTAVELPGFARKLIPANTTVTQTFEWDPPADDGSRTGRWSAEAKGAPVAVGGPTHLERDGGGTRHVYLGRVKASVPVVGGRLETFALDSLRRDLGRTASYTAAQLNS